MVLRPGDLFGESAFIPGSTRPSTAIALSACAALALDRSTFESLLEHDRSIAARIVEQLVRRLRDAEDQIEILLLRDTQSKIVSALLKLCQKAQSDAAGAAMLQISPMELSTRVGLDVETIKRGVQKLRDAQYVRVQDEKIEVPDVDALKRLYGLLGVKDEIQGADFAGQPGRSGAR
jgi:CRP/FNR family cyclic AMP-dependent transcriptional regulator